MANPYAQVALGYLRRPFSSFRAGLVILSALAATVPPAVVATQYQGPKFALLLLPVWVLVALFAYHLLGQFADPRAHLLPHFRRVHATVAGAVGLTLIVLVPAAATWLSGLRSVGLVAVAVLVSGMILWSVLASSNWGILLVTAAYISLLTSPANQFLAILVSGRFEAQAVALLVAGLFLTLCAGLRLMRMTEDTPGYRLKEAFDRVTGQLTGRPMATPRPCGQPVPLRWPARWLMDRRMARVTEQARGASASWWCRVCRWQVGLPGWEVGLLISLMMVLFVQLFGALFGAEGRALFQGCWVYAVLFPSFMVAGGFGQRMHGLGRELLLPVQRAAYLRQLGLAAAVSVIQWWLAITATFALWAFVFAPGSIDISLLAGLIVASALVQIPLFGVLAWLARYRSAAVCITLATLAGMLVGIGFGVAPHVSGQTRELLLYGAGISAVLGLPITWDAYRRWLVTELG
jgi:hypothetical protein